jgi:hypothetical protein
MLPVITIDTTDRGFSAAPFSPALSWPPIILNEISSEGWRCLLADEDGVTT